MHPFSTQKTDYYMYNHLSLIPLKNVEEKEKTDLEIKTYAH